MAHIKKSFSFAPLALFQHAADIRWLLPIAVTLLSAVSGLVVALILPQDSQSIQLLVVIGISTLFMLPITIQALKGNYTPVISILVVLVPVLAELVVPTNQIEGGRRDYLEYYYTAVSILLILAFTVIGLGRKQKSIPTFSVPVAMQSGLIALSIGSIFASVQGLIQGNNLSYLVGDFVKPIMMLLTFVVISQTEPNGKKIVSWWFLGGLLLSQVIIIFREIQSGEARLASAFWPNGLALFIGSLTVLWLVRGRSGRTYLGFLGITASSIALIVMGFRSTIIYAVLSLLMVLAIDQYWRIRHRIRSPLLFRLALILVAVIILTNGPLSNLVASDLAQLQRRFSVVSAGLEADTSYTQRTLEVQVITSRLVSGGLTSMLFGYGNGAQFDLPIGSSLQAIQLYQGTNYQVHNVHVFIFGVLYRGGIFGLVCWIIFLSACVRTVFGGLIKSLQQKSTDQMMIAFWSLIYSSMILLASFQFGLLDRELLLMILVSLVGTNVVRDRPDKKGLAK